MASTGGRADPTVAELLLEEGYRFDFFQAVRVLERLHPDRQRVGYDSRPSREVARFCAQLTLDFPASAIHDIVPDADGGPPQMTVAFMGFTGPLGVLPRHYTEMLIERVRRKDFALRDFLDLFNHRFISLFYRAWEKYRVPIAYERAALQRRDDRFSLYLFDFFGMGTDGLRGRLDVADRPLLYYAGLLAQQPRSASALAGLLSDYFGVRVEIVQLLGQWLALDPDSRTRIGRAGIGVNQVLGDSALAGSHVWDQQAKFRVRLGPLDLEAFDSFLPSGKTFRPLVQLTRLFAGQSFDFDLQLMLKAAEVPYCRLGAGGAAAPRLGWSAWLKTRDFTHDADDAVFAGQYMRVGALPG